jgi:hypothetical protein
LAPATQPGGLVGQEDLAALLPALPEVEEWEIPVRCFRCHHSYNMPAHQFMIGNVLFCPHCHKSMVVKDTLSFQIRASLKEAYETWQSARSDLDAKRQRELKELLEKREREVQELIASERRSMEKLKEKLNEITETYDAPGKAAKRRGLLAWG